MGKHKQTPQGGGKRPLRVLRDGRGLMDGGMIDELVDQGDVVLSTSSTAGTRPPDGHIEAADPETGEIERMAYWLPDGVTAEDIGLKHGRAM